MKVDHKKRADRVIEVFKSSALNQRQFSELIGVSQQLVSAVINYSKKPNETILFGIIDNIKHVDPLWLLTGAGKENTTSINLDQIQSPIEFHIKEIVKRQIEEFSNNILQRLSNIEETVNQANP